MNVFSGLLHHIGAWSCGSMLLINLGLLLTFLKKSDDRFKTESKYFAFDHGAFGGAVLSAWKKYFFQETFIHHHWLKTYPLNPHSFLADNQSLGCFDRFFMGKGAWDFSYPINLVP